MAEDFTYTTLFEPLGDAELIQLWEKFHRAWDAAPYSSPIEGEMELLQLEIEDEAETRGLPDPLTGRKRVNR